MSCMLLGWVRGWRCAACCLGAGGCMCATCCVAWLHVWHVLCGVCCAALCLQADTRVLDIASVQQAVDRALQVGVGLGMCGHVWAWMQEGRGGCQAGLPPPPQQRR